jgi:hypothetical protein
MEERARTNELDADERRRMIGRRGKTVPFVWVDAGVGVVVSPGSWLVCGEGGSREHPFGLLRQGDSAMTVIPGIGLLSQVSEWRVAGSCDFASSPGAW